MHLRPGRSRQQSCCLACPFVIPPTSGDGLDAGDNLHTTAELGTVPSRSWSEAALQSLPWSVRARVRREIGGGAAGVPVDAELLHATLRYVPDRDLRRQVNALPANGTRAKPCGDSTCLTPLCIDAFAMAVTAPGFPPNLQQIEHWLDDISCRDCDREGVVVHVDSSDNEASTGAAPRNALVLQVFIAGYSAPRSNMSIVEQLLTARHEIAGMLGAKSYAHYQARPCGAIIICWSYVWQPG